MKNASNYIVWFTFFVMLVYIISLFLPSHVKVHHSEVIHGNIHDVYEQFEQINNWGNWCVWTEEAKKSQVIYSEQNSGSGAFFKWKHGRNNRSVGKLEIIQERDLQNIEFRIKASNIDSVTTFVYFQKVEDGTLVEWTSDLELQDSGARLTGYLLKRWLLRDIKKSLRNINKYLLSVNKHSGWVSENYTILESKKDRIFTIKDTISHTVLDSILEVDFNKIKEMLVKNISYEPEMLFYRRISDINSSTSVYLIGTGIPASAPEMVGEEKYPAKFLVMKYYGSVSGFKKATRKARQIAQRESFKIDTNPFVSYNSFPPDRTVIDTNSMVLCYPIR